MCGGNCDAEIWGSGQSWVCPSCVEAKICSKLAESSKPTAITLKFVHVPAIDTASASDETSVPSLCFVTDGVALGCFSRQIFSAENIAHNNKVLEYCRTSLCTIGGMVSGE